MSNTPTPPAGEVVASYEQVAQDANLFTATLQDLHRSLATKFASTNFAVPIIGGKTLDLHRLFVEVTARGGLEKVIRNRQWKEIIAVFSFPATITNGSFVLRKYYISLLHQYEQVYYFRKQAPPSVQLQAATTPTVEKNIDAIQLPGMIDEELCDRETPNEAHKPQPLGNSEIWPGRWVTGLIDGKFDNGYLVSVSFGSEKLKGVLYHTPIDAGRYETATSSKAVRRRNRKRSRLAARDPFHPKPNRTGYNFFYSEHYARLKSLHRGQEKTISTRIAHLWSQLSEAEKEVYQEKGVRDKQRYQCEMLEYRQSSSGPKMK